MVYIEVYSKYEKIKYKSTLCSRTTFFVVLTKIILIILPFILAYNTTGFWIKSDTFNEQPDIKYTYKYIFIAETDDSNLKILCSNIINFKERIFDHNSEKCSSIKILEQDYNQDGKYDELFFSLTVDNLENFKLHSITLILPLDYKIHTTCPMQMQTAAIMQYFYINPGVKMNFIGDISLVQYSPVPCYSHRIFSDYNVTLIDKNNFELWSFIEQHFRRNISTRIDHSYITWISGSIKSFNIDIHLRYSEQTIYYKPNFWQVIKFAWIQYLAVFLAVRCIINKIENFVFNNKLVLYYVDKSYKKLC